MTFALIPDPDRLDGVLAQNLGARWPVEKVVAKFGESPNGFGTGHDWWFQNEQGQIYSLSCRRGVFVIGAKTGFLPEDIRSFLDWLTAELQ
jgi:hypothetical protein